MLHNIRISSERTTFQHDKSLVYPIRFQQKLIYEDVLNNVLFQNCQSINKIDVLKIKVGGNFVISFFGEL